MEEWLSKAMHPDDDRGPRAGAADVEHDLEQWLSKVKFDIADGVVPKLKVEVLSVSVEVTLSGLVCDQLRVGGLRGIGGGGAAGEQLVGLRRVPPLPGSWGFAAEAVALRCRGDVAYSTSIGLSGSATAAVTASSARFGASLRFNSSDVAEPRVPDSVAFENCTSELGLSLKVLGGTFWTKIVEWLPGVVGALQDRLDSEANVAMCREVLDAAEKEANAFMAQAHAVAREAMQEGAPPEPVMNDSYVRWHEAGPIRWAQQAQEVASEELALDRLARYLYSDGRFCVVGDDDASSNEYRETVSQANSSHLFCLWSDAPSCILGGGEDAQCVFRRSIRQDPPAVLQLWARATDVGLALPNASLVANNSTLRVRGSSGPMDLRMQFGMHFNGTAGEAQADLEGLFELKVVVDRSHVEVAVQAGLDRATFDQVPPHNYLVGTCVAPSFREMRVFDMAAHLPIQDVRLSVLRPASINTSLLPGAVGLVEDMLRSLLAAYGPAVAPTLLGASRSVALPQADAALRRWAAAQEAGSCPEPKGQDTHGHTQRPMIDRERSRAYLRLAEMLTIIAALLAVSAEVIRLCGRQRRRPRSSSRASSQRELQLEAALSYDIEEDPQIAADARPRSRLHHLFACVFDGSLIASSAVPWSVALSMPVLTLALASFCLGSNFMQFAQTFVTLRSSPPAPQSGAQDLFFEPPVPIYEVMVYSLFYSISELKRSHLDALAHVVFAFSGVLPYLKLALMLLSWILPKRIMPGCVRGFFLLSMDQFGKYSLVDVFVIQFISAALSTTVEVGDVLRSNSTAPRKVGSPGILLRTNQDWGFAAFVLASVGSLLVGHVSLHCHRKDEGAALAARCRQPPRSTSGLGRALGRLTQRSVGDGGFLAQFRQRPRFRMSCCLVLAMVLVFGGCCSPAFEVELDTPFGSLGKSEFTIFSLAARLPGLTEHPNSFATRFGQATYIVFAFATVHCHLVILGVFMFARISDEYLRLAATAARTLFAWSALDVVVGSMIITLLEMRMSDFVILHGSDRIFLGKALKLQEPYTGQGLYVHVRLGPGAYILGAAAVVHFFVSRPIMNMLDAAATDYEQARTRERSRDGTESWLPHLSADAGGCVDEVADGGNRMPEEEPAADDVAEGAPFHALEPDTEAKTTV